MWTVFVVINSPSFNLLLCVVKRQEPIFIETFSPNASIEGFNERVIRWFGPMEWTWCSLTYLEWQPLSLRNDPTSRAEG
jgi:hypothetical protein